MAVKGEIWTDHLADVEMCKIVPQKFQQQCPAGLRGEEQAEYGHDSPVYWHISGSRSSVPHKHPEGSYRIDQSHCASLKMAL